MGTLAPPATAKKLFTVAEFARMSDPSEGGKQELVRGEVVTMPPPGYTHGKVQGNVYFALKLWAKHSKLGEVTVESGLVTELGPDTVRGPDVAFWSYARVPADREPDVYPDVAADLVAEVLSPSNTRPKMAAKVREYFAAGVRLVWVIDPDDRTVTAYHKPGDGRVVWADATLTAEDVLPGFACPVADFFE